MRGKAATMQNIMRRLDKIDVSLHQLYVAFDSFGAH